MPATPGLPPPQKTSSWAAHLCAVGALRSRLLLRRAALLGLRHVHGLALVPCGCRWGKHGAADLGERPRGGDGCCQLLGRAGDTSRPQCTSSGWQVALALLLHTHPSAHQSAPAGQPRAGGLLPGAGGLLPGAARPPCASRRGRRRRRRGPLAPPPAPWRWAPGGPPGGRPAGTGQGHRECERGAGNGCSREPQQRWSISSGAAAGGQRVWRILVGQRPACCARTCWRSGLRGRQLPARAPHSPWPCRGEGEAGRRGCDWQRITRFPKCQRPAARRQQASRALTPAPAPRSRSGGAGGGQAPVRRWRRTSAQRRRGPAGRRAGEAVQCSGKRSTRWQVASVSAQGARRAGAQHGASVALGTHHKQLGGRALALLLLLLQEEQRQRGPGVWCVGGGAHSTALGCQGFGALLLSPAAAAPTASLRASMLPRHRNQGAAAAAHLNAAGCAVVKAEAALPAGKGRHCRAPSVLGLKWRFCTTRPRLYNSQGTSERLFGCLPAACLHSTAHTAPCKFEHPPARALPRWGAPPQGTRRPSRRPTGRLAAAAGGGAPPPPPPLPGLARPAGSQSCGAPLPARGGRRQGRGGGARAQWLGRSGVGPAGDGQGVNWRPYHLLLVATGAPRRPAALPRAVQLGAGCPEACG